MPLSERPRFSELRKHGRGGFVPLGDLALDLPRAAVLLSRGSKRPPDERVVEVDWYTTRVANCAWLNPRARRTARICSANATLRASASDTTG